MEDPTIEEAVEDICELAQRNTSHDLDELDRLYEELTNEH